MKAQDTNYFRKRIAEEEARERVAVCPSARRAHRELAGLYRRLIEGNPLPQLVMEAG